MGLVHGSIRQIPPIHNLNDLRGHMVNNGGGNKFITQGYQKEIYFNDVCSI